MNLKSKVFLSKLIPPIEKKFEKIHVQLEKALNDPEQLKEVDEEIRLIRSALSLIDGCKAVQIISEIALFSRHLMQSNDNINAANLNTLISSVIIFPFYLKREVEGSFNLEYTEKIVSELKAARGIEGVRLDKVSSINIPYNVPHTLVEKWCSNQYALVDVKTGFPIELLGLMKSKESKDASKLLAMAESVAHCCTNEGLLVVTLVAVATARICNFDQPARVALEMINEFGAAISKINDLPEDTVAQLVKPSTVKKAMAWISTSENADGLSMALLEEFGLSHKTSAEVEDSIDTELPVVELQCELLESIEFAKTFFNRVVDAQTDSHFTSHYSSFVTRLIHIKSICQFSGNVHLEGAKADIQGIIDLVYEVKSISHLTPALKEGVTEAIFRVERLAEKIIENEAAKSLFEGVNDTRPYEIILDVSRKELVVTTKVISDYLKGNKTKDAAIGACHEMMSVAGALLFINVADLSALIIISVTTIKAQIESHDLVEQFEESKEFKTACLGLVICQEFIANICDGFSADHILLSKGIEKFADCGIERTEFTLGLSTETDISLDIPPIKMLVEEYLSVESLVDRARKAYLYDSSTDNRQLVVALTKIADSAEIASEQHIWMLCRCLIDAINSHIESGLDDDSSIEEVQETIKNGFNKLSEQIACIAEGREACLSNSLVIELRALANAENDIIDHVTEQESPLVDSDEIDDELLNDEFLSIYRLEIERFVVEGHVHLGESKGTTPTKGLIRAIHSLRGASGSVEFVEACESYGIIEETLVEMTAQGIVVGNQVIDYLGEIFEQAIVVAEAYPGNKLPIHNQFKRDHIHSWLTPEENKPQVEHHKEVKTQPQSVVELSNESGEINADADYDPDLLELFLEEVDEVTQKASTVLLRWKDDCKNADELNSFKREIHTLKGLGNLVDIDSPIGLACHELESLLEILAAGDTNNPDDVFTLCDVVLSATSEMVSEVKNLKKPEKPVALLRCLESAVGNGVIDLNLLKFQEISKEKFEEKQVSILVNDNITDHNEDFISDHELTEQGNSQAYDQDMLELFTEEGNKLADSIDELSNAWINDQGNIELTKKLKRSMHTMKGLGFLLDENSVLGDLAGRMESLYEDIVEGMKLADTSVVHLSASRMANMVSLISKNQKPDEDRKLVSLIEDNYNKSSEEIIDEQSCIQDGSDTEITVNPISDVSLEVGSENHDSAVNDAETEDPVEPSETEDSSSATMLHELVSNLKSHRIKRKKTKSGNQAAQLKIDPVVVDKVVNMSNEISGTSYRLDAISAECVRGLGDISDKIDMISKISESLTLFSRNLLNRGAAAEFNTSDGLEQFDEKMSDMLVRLDQYAAFLNDDILSVVSTFDTLKSTLNSQYRVIRDQREVLLETRLVNLTKNITRFNHAVSGAATKLGKKVNIRYVNETLQVDKNVLEAMCEPLCHVLRNAVAHGIEAPEMRSAAGKSVSGEISLEVSKSSNNIIFKVSDDGAGVDVDRLRLKAEAAGIVRENDELSIPEAMSLMFESGITTAEKLTDVSGRGVGMDAVKTQVENLGGHIDVYSESGKGTTFEITLPEVVGYRRCLVVTAAGVPYAIPSGQLISIEYLSIENTVKAREEKELHIYGKTYAYIHFADLIGMPSQKIKHREESCPIILAHVDGQDIAIEADATERIMEFNTRQLPESIRHIPSITGYSEMPNGDPIYILDLVGLYRTNLVTGKLPLEVKVSKIRAADENRQSKALVVDDSSAYRISTQRLLESMGYDVEIATQGVHGLEILSSGYRPDVILLDAEMPGMDGFSFARAIKSRTSTADIPVIMITSRTGEKFEKRAKEVGIDVFMNKPFKKENLLEAIDRLLFELGNY